MTEIELLPQTSGPYRLGRHRAHDPRSRTWDVRELSPAHFAIPERPVAHARHAPVWDQGDLGSCTAHAAAGMLMTDPLWRRDRTITQGLILALYSEETQLDDDEIPGHWPPQDTGSAGIYSMRACLARRWISSYRWSFDLRTTLATLGRQPVSVGIPWYDSMFDPDPFGTVHISPAAQVVGGHQVLLDGVDPARRRARFCNSWGPRWGVLGWAWISFDDLGRLLSEGGDAVVGVP